MSIYKLPEYEQHPVALALMPGGMDDAEFDALCEDIQERGILFPASLYQGKVLDGWHRYRAAKRTGTELKFVEYKGKDPAGYIASCNVLRRKLSSLQRALVGARLHRDHGITQRDACKKLGISNEVITLVLKTIDSKNTRLIKRIEMEADFTRGLLKEELEDAGLLRAKPKAEVDVSTLTNSVFNMGRALPDTDGTDEDDLLDGLLTEQDDSLPDDPAEVAARREALDAAAERKTPKAPKVSAAELLSVQFRALMADEREAFLKLIWPLAQDVVQGAAWAQQDTPTKALKRAAKAK